MNSDYINFTFQEWGTVINVIYEKVTESEKYGLLIELRKYFELIDKIFSTYRFDSEITNIRNRDNQNIDLSNEFLEVMDGCKRAKELTDGAFDPWSLPLGLDFSGYVKGWASQKGVELLNSLGIKSVQINSAGDIHVSGGYKSRPWKIGIRDPENPHRIVKVFEIEQGAVATSGTYERGSHIHDPFTGMIAIGARSATVIGPDGGLADALATALVVAGKDGASWFSKPELSEYSAWVIERHSDKAWGINLK